MDKAKLQQTNSEEPFLFYPQDTSTNTREKTLSYLLSIAASAIIMLSAAMYCRDKVIDSVFNSMDKISFEEFIENSKKQLED